MKYLTIDFLVGIFVLLGIGALAFLAIKVTDVSILSRKGQQSYTIFAKFDNIGSLKVTAPVKVSGFKVGQITNIQLDPKTYQAIVTMDLNNKYKFSADSSAQILTTGLLGEQYIALQSGADNSFLENGGTITLTSSAMVLENLIGKFMTNLSTK